MGIIKILKKKLSFFFKNTSQPRMEILVSTNISVLGFYGYIGDISVDIFT